jgi:recombination protein RecR
VSTIIPHTMNVQSEAIEAVVEHFASLPSIGRKTAQRLAFFLLRQSDEFIHSFATSLIRMKESVHSCSVCFTYTEHDPCPICSSERRDRTVICVVEQPTDVLIIERMSEFKGLYHVLHGNINPLEGINPDDLKIRELIARLDSNVKEIILALNPTVEGEVTMQYLARMIKPLEIIVSRPARGIPIGSELEYTDEATLSKALESRITM